MTRRRALLGATLLAALGVQSQAQTCANSSLNGTYFYQLGGNVATAAGIAPYVELGKLVADGNGSVFGSSSVSIAGVLASFSLSGSYAVEGNCTGTLTLVVNLQSTEAVTFQIVGGGQSAVVAFSSSGGVVTGRAYRAASAGQCGGNASFSGGYGYLLSGVAGALLYSDAGQVVSDGSGNLTTLGATNLGAGAKQTSGTGSYFVASTCFGTAKIVNQNGTANYILAFVEGGNVLFMESDAGTTVSGAAQPQQIQSILPDFVFGGGWSSALYFGNTTNGAVSFPVTFIGDDGKPMTVPSVGGSIAVVNLAPNGTASIQAVNVGTLIQGYASVSLPAGVTAYGVFHYGVPGVSDQEAVVQLSSAVATTSTLIWDDTKFLTAVAIVNPSPVATTVAVTLRGAGGALLGTSAVALGPRSKVAVVLRNLPGLAGMGGNQGTANFTVATGNVVVMGIRYTGSAYTSIPTTQQ
ncbi:MAG TPA: hypothetical protein VGR73_20545 [Bryobacteraceae bacterium]|nr:hypothetical protein [Bryobacteraceae bacterium]